MKVKFKKTNEFAVLPSYADNEAAGLDMTAVSKHRVYDTDGTLKYISYDTGIAVEIPSGYVGYIYPRSSISNYKLDLCNAVGVIDQNFRGNITFRFRALSASSDSEYKIGERIGQLIIAPVLRIEVVESNTLTETKRGLGAYGSSGR
jgi:dUTP pyrophosphatase